MAFTYQISGDMPILTINLNGNNALLTWPPTAGWSLHRSPGLLSGSWQPVSLTTDGALSYPIMLVQPPK